MDRLAHGGVPVTDGRHRDPADQVDYSAPTFDDQFDAFRALDDQAEGVVAGPGEMFPERRVKRIQGLTANRWTSKIVSARATFRA
jgi:hypothetical protein